MTAANSDSEAVETGTLARLRAVCDAATPAPWTWWDYRHGGGRASVGDKLICDAYPGAQDGDASNREFIKAFDPERVRALLDIAEAAHEVSDAREAFHVIGSGVPGGGSTILDALDEKLAALSVLDQEAQ